ncbi:MAG: hypothetical protein P8Q99_13260 [Paracoccaceae bacterium]|nr:hypothetical protein [Paracoccaceae bacterium]
MLMFGVLGMLAFGLLIDAFLGDDDDTSESTPPVDDGTIYGSTGDDILNTGPADDIVNAGAGSDIVHGGLGNDVIDGWTGDDELFGDQGDDTLLGY